MKLVIMMLVLSTNNVEGVNMKMQDTNSASSPEIPHPGMHTYHSASFSRDSLLLECIAYHSASSLEISCSWNCTAYHSASSLEISCSWNCTAYHSASSLEISMLPRCTAYPFCIVSGDSPVPECTPFSEDSMLSQSIPYHSACCTKIPRPENAHPCLEIPRS